MLGFNPSIPTFVAKIHFMYIQQIYTACLAQASYYIESNGEAAIIDPLRDYHQYIDLATSRTAKIKYVFETHFHADFVSGHIDLAAETDATIVFGPKTQTGYTSYVATDGEELKVGNITIQVLHTPGHTPESTCYLLKDEQGKPHCVFTGDTLFVGDVGRPDLLDGLMSKEELAGMMYDSLRNTLMPLPDDLIVYPAHGAGSACGKNIGKETFSTIGEQKQSNYALQQMSRDQFIQTITEGIAPAPAYFFKDAKLNKQGYAAFSSVIKIGLSELTIADFEAAIRNGATVLDTRIPDVFEQGFIKGAINIGINGQFAIWAATVLDIHQPIVIIAEPGTEQESVERLTRVGFDQIRGFLSGGFEAWKNANKRYDMVISIDTEEFELDAKHTDITILDVRKTGEWNSGHLSKAKHLPLDSLAKDYTQLNPDDEYLIYCGGGYRSMIAASLLKSKGFERVKNVYGGYAAIKELKLDFTKPKQ
jgi:glyoxylase-like metal-dependent hydrolase (beta-lactamase superfamily II)/rhodanese-related sulfurtransferase